MEMAKAEAQLMEVLLLKHAQKLFAIEENFNSLFKDHTVQEDCLVQTRNPLKKFEKQKFAENLKSSRAFKYVKSLERFESHYDFFCLSLVFESFEIVLMLLFKTCITSSI